MEYIYVQFDGMVYQQKAAIPIGTNCVPLIADLFLPLQLTVLSRCRDFRIIECEFLFSISKFSTNFELKLF